MDSCRIRLRVGEEVAQGVKNTVVLVDKREPWEQVADRHEPHDGCQPSGSHPAEDREDGDLQSHDVRAQLMDKDNHPVDAENGYESSDARHRVGSRKAIKIDRVVFGTGTLGHQPAGHEIGALSYPLPPGCRLLVVTPA